MQSWDSLFAPFCQNHHWFTPAHLHQSLLSPVPDSLHFRTEHTSSTRKVRKSRSRALLIPEFQTGTKMSVAESFTLQSVGDASICMIPFQPKNPGK
jgi:hypothetical protein